MASSTMSISGIVSGIDWESMIDTIIEKAQQPAMVQVNKRTNLTNKKTLFEEMKVSVQSLQSSISPLKLPSTYKAKELEIERLDKTGSYKGVLTATVNADAEVNLYNLKVNQLATAETRRSNQISGTFSSIDGMPANSKLYINSGGQRVGVDVSSTDTVQALKSRINTALKTLDTPMAVTASVVDNKLILKSDNTGLGEDTVTETINYPLGDTTTLESIAVDKRSDGEFVIRKGSKSWTEANGDFQIVNGNEVRWKKYEDSNTVTIGDTFTATYTAAGGDSFTSGTIRRDTSTSDDDEKNSNTDKDVLNFTVKNIVDKSRFTITTSDDKTYICGEDFEIDGRSIVWNEGAGPANGTRYTLSYNAGVRVNAEDASVTKQNIVRLEYDGGASYGGKKTYLTYDQLIDQLGIKSTNSSMDEDEIESIETSNAAAFDENFIVRDTSTGTIYEYGQDFTVESDESGLPIIVWAEGADVPSSMSDLSITYTLNASGVEVLDGALASADQRTIFLKYTDDNGNEDYLKFNDILNQLGIASNALDSDDDETRESAINTFNKYFTVTDSDGQVYKYGDDFIIEADEDSGLPVLTWLNSDEPATLNITYTADSTELTTVDTSVAVQRTLFLKGDSDDDYLTYSQILEKMGVSSSSSDEEITEAFNKYFAVSDTNNPTYEYEYGYDFTVSADSSGMPVISFTDGYEPDSAAITLTANVRTVETSTSISSQHKILLQGDDGEYLTLNDMLTQMGLSSEELNSTEADTITKVNNVFSRYLTVTNSNGDEYEYNYDFTIEADGETGQPVIVWSNNSEPDELNIRYVNASNLKKTDDTVTVTGQRTIFLQNAEGDYLTYNQILEKMGLDESDLNDEEKVSEAFNSYFTLTGATGTEYDYGDEFTIIAGEDGLPALNWLGGYTTETLDIVFTNAEVTETFNYTSVDNRSILRLKNEDGSYITYDEMISQLGLSDDDLADDDKVAEAFSKYLVVTDSSGKEYKYGEYEDFIIRRDDSGLPVILPVIEFNGGYDPGKLTVEYSIADESKAITATSVRNQSAITLKKDDGETLSFEQMLEKLGVDSTDDITEDIFSKYFTITDSSGEVRQYGLDFVVSSDVNSDLPAIRWVRGDDPGKITVEYEDVDTADPIETTSVANQSILRLQYSESTDDTEGEEAEGTEETDEVEGDDSESDATESSSTTGYLSYSQMLDKMGGDAANFSKYLTVTGSDGAEYQYGQDFTVIEDTVSGLPVISWGNIGENVSNLQVKFAVDAKSKEINSSTSSTVNQRTILFEDSKGESYGSAKYISYEQMLKNMGLTGDELNDEDAIAEAFRENLAVTDSSGNRTYEYGQDFTISRDDNSGLPVIVWQNGDLPNDLDIKYTAFSEKINGSVTDQDIMRIKYPLGESYGGVSYLTYDQMASHMGITSGMSSAEIGEAFNTYLTVSNGANRYWYNDDFTVGSDESGLPVIIWQNGSEPDDLDNLTIQYAVNDSGGDEFEFDMTRSTKDMPLYAVNTTAQPNRSEDDKPLYSKFEGGTTTITQGTRTYYEGIDFDLTKDSDGVAVVEWKADSQWYMPDPGETYTVNLTQKDGTVKTYNGMRSWTDSLDMSALGFSIASGNLSKVSYGEDSYDLYSSGDDSQPVSGLSMNVSKNSRNDGTEAVFSFNWSAPERTLREDMPEYGDELTAEYTYNVNTFTLEDNSNGDLLRALGLEIPDPDEDPDYYEEYCAEHYTKAQDAILELDGETITRSSNYIGESYNNELIKGMTIQLKGVGEVSMEVAHDAQKAVESIETLVDSYNSLMSWINTRSTEKQVDKDTAATIDSDDFRMRWGLLYGNSLLRQTKSSMRSLISQNFTFSFTQRTSSEEIYGTMAHNGLKNSSTMRLRIGDKYADITIDPDDTLQDIVDKISDSSHDSSMHDLYYDENDKLLQEPLVKASIEDDKLVIRTTSKDEITMSGTAAMNALKMNYTYRGLYQIGLATTSDDYGKSGELEFDSNAFMEALEDNPDEVQDLMLKFASQLDTWVKSMLTSSSSGETSGTLTREIENIESQISDIDDYLEDYQDRLDRQEDALRTKYSAAEQQLAKLTQQASSIAAILNQLNGYASNSSSSS